METNQRAIAFVLVDSQYTLSDSLEVFELENARVVQRKVLLGIPRRSMEALQTAESLEASPSVDVLWCVHFVRELQLLPLLAELLEPASWIPGKI